MKETGIRSTQGANTGLSELCIACVSTCFSYAVFFCVWISSKRWRTRERGEGRAAQLCRINKLTDSDTLYSKEGSLMKNEVIVYCRRRQVSKNKEKEKRIQWPSTHYYAHESPPLSVSHTRQLMQHVLARRDLHFLSAWTAESKLQRVRSNKILLRLIEPCIRQLNTSNSLRVKISIF